MTEETLTPQTSTSPAKKDKKAVLNETIDDAQLAQFFTLLPPQGVDRDYHILERAYRGLQAADFARFIELFVAAQHNLHAKGPQGSMIEVVSRHARSRDYLAALKKYA